MKRIIGLTIIFVGCLLLNIVIGYKLVSYDEISLEWKVALLTIILLLPMFFFLIISLHVNYVSMTRIFRLQDKFRIAYNEIQIKPNDEHEGGSNIDKPKDGGSINPTDFSRMLNQRDIFLSAHNPELRGTFRQGLEIYQKTEKQYEVSGTKDTVQRDILVFEMGKFIPEIVKRDLISHRLDFDSYILPLSFFLFAYYCGILIMLPLINSLFSHDAQSASYIIPLFNNSKAIPFLVVQWGFLGGLVYISISLISRFLRKDLSPRVYLVSALRLFLASVAAVVIFLSSVYFYSRNGYSEIPIQVLLTCFLMGVAPIQFLVNFADSRLSHVSKFWERRNVAGNRSPTTIEGISSTDAERLSEEGINCVHQMAFCSPVEIAKATKYPWQVVKDWKDRSILYLLTADVELYKMKSNESKKSKTYYLFDHLNSKMGVRTMSGLIKLWDELGNKNDNKSILKALEFNEVELTQERVNAMFIQIVAEGRHILSSKVLDTFEI